MRIGDCYSHGVYVVAAGAWTRSADLTSGSQFPAAAVFVDEGTTYALTAWVCSVPAPVTVGTTAISFVKFASTTPYVFRNGLTQTGQNVDVTPGDTSLTATANSLVVNLASGGAIITSSGLKINLESSNPTLQISSNQLGVKLDPARAITAGTSGIGVNVDGVTLNILSNAVAVKAAGIGSTQLGPTAFDQASITGGSGTSASVQYAPAIKRSMTAGQSFSANTTYALRWGIPSKGETAGQVYSADISTTSYDLFYVIGVFSSASAVSAGGTIVVTCDGAYTLGSSDTAFSTAQVGLPVFLAASGAYSATAPSTTGQAIVRLGIVSSTTTIDVNPAPVGVY